MLHVTNLYSIQNSTIIKVELTMPWYNYSKPLTPMIFLLIPSALTALAQNVFYQISVLKLHLNTSY